MAGQEATDYTAWRERLVSGMVAFFYTAEWLDQRLDEGSAFFFASDRAAMVVELIAFPTGVVAVKAVVAAGDTRAMIQDLGPAVLEWAAANGATAAMIESRTGWKRLMRKHGFQEFTTTLVKVL